MAKNNNFGGNLILWMTKNVNFGVRVICWILVDFGGFLMNPANPPKFVPKIRYIS